MRRVPEHSLLRHADFLKLWGGQTVSRFGSQVTVVALPLTAVLTLHATTFEVGALAAVELAPFLLFGLVAGALVDRRRKRRTLILADVLRMLSLGSVPVAAVLDVLTLGQLYAVAFVTGVGTVLFDVADQSYLPELVGHDKITDGNAKLQASESASILAGPAFAGFLVQAIGAARTIAVDAVSYLVSVASLLWIRRPEETTASAEGAPRLDGLRRDIAEGVRFVGRHRTLRPLVGCTAVANIGWSMAMAVLTVFMVRTLHLSPGLIGLTFTASSATGLVGALLVGRINSLVRLGPAIFATSLVASSGMLLMPLATRANPLPYLFAGSALTGFTVPYNIDTVSVRQALCPPHLLGRMNATVRSVIWGLNPLAALAGGALGHWLGLRPTLWIGAGIAMLAPLFPLLSPQVRRLTALPEVSPATASAGPVEPALSPGVG